MIIQKSELLSWQKTVEKNQQRRKILKDFNYKFTIRQKRNKGLQRHKTLTRFPRHQRMSSLESSPPEAVQFARKNYVLNDYTLKIPTSKSVEIKFTEEGIRYLKKLKSDKTYIFRKSDIILLELLLNSLSHDLKKKEMKNNSSN